MMRLSIALEIRSGGRNQDRAACFETKFGCVLVLADGAGGVGSGAASAEEVIHAAEKLAKGELSSAEDALATADQRINRVGGQSTGVIVEIRDGQLRGASCGDSEAWLFRGDDLIDLTALQSRKPLLGDYGWITSFGPLQFDGILLIASDGLLNYSRRSDVLPCLLRATSPSEAANQLVDLVQLSSGSYQDDVSVILAVPV